MICIGGGGIVIVQNVNEKIFMFAQALIQGKEFKPSFIVDDAAASAERVSGEFLLREQNRNYLRVGAQRIELITRDDAKFLYQEGRMKKLVLFEPTDAELAEILNFYKPDLADVLIFRR